MLLSKVKLKLQIITIYDYGVIILLLFRKLLLLVFQQLIDTISNDLTTFYELAKLIIRQEKM